MKKAATKPVATGKGFALRPQGDAHPTGTISVQENRGVRDRCGSSPEEPAGLASCVRPGQGPTAFPGKAHPPRGKHPAPGKTWLWAQQGLHAAQGCGFAHCLTLDDSTGLTGRMAGSIFT